MTEQSQIRPEIVIIGAGGAGLSTSYYLSQHGLDHIVLERGIIGNTWATERWDAFHLVNPNWAVRLPSFHYGSKACGGDDPDGYLSREETVDYLHRYARHIDASVLTGIEVCSLSRRDERYELLLGDGRTLNCAVVVVATGAFGPPKAPPFAAQIDDSITQIHSAHYRNAEQAPSGAVLVIGSGQSGAQIAEDLQDAGRQVFLSVGRAGRRPRRYRGYDSSWWMRELGYFDRTLDNVDEATRQRILSGMGGAGSGHVGGGKGGHDIYLRAFCRDGMHLVGSVTGAEGQVLQLEQNLLENLDGADDAAANFKRAIDEHIEATGMDLPLDGNPDPPGIEAWPKAEGPSTLDLKAEGITTIIWATGFGYNYDWIKLPVGDHRDFPIQQRGVTRWPGLYFMGLQWMYGANSAQFYGVHEDAAYVADHIAACYR